MNKTKRRLSAIVVIASVLLLAVLALSTGIASAESAKDELPAADIQAVIEEIDEHVHELINGTMALHDNTEQIADNETLDEDLRAKAEEVHVESHELLYIAEDIQELVDELKDLAKDPAANKAKMGEAIDEIKEHLEEYTEALDANHDLVHDILSTVSETHKVYAEATQDAMQELEGITEDLEEHLDELQGLLENGAEEIQEAVDELVDNAKELKKLVRRMNKPAHAIPGDAGAGIHTQFHRVEGFAVAIYDSVDELEELAADPERNKEEIRKLVVKELYGQVNSLWGKLPAAVSGMSELVEQALTADPGDANALKVQDILDEIEDAQFELDEQVKELGEKVQDPIIWQCKCMAPANPHRLENGHTLIAEHNADRIIEVTPDGEIVWEYTDVVTPIEAQRLENGNTLIADTGNRRVIEVTPDGGIVWEYYGEESKALGLSGVRRLANGNTLIPSMPFTEDDVPFVIEVTPDKEIVWEYTEAMMPSLGQRLENGNTLMTDMMNPRVIEVTPDGEIVWEYSGEELAFPYVAQRLENGNTLIGDQFQPFPQIAPGYRGQRVIEVTPDGTIEFSSDIGITLFPYPKIF
jgi:ABC-type transporter Mla subunit MlaD